MKTKIQTAGETANVVNFNFVEAIVGYVVNMYDDIKRDFSISFTKGDIGLFAQANGVNVDFLLKTIEEEIYAYLLNEYNDRLDGTFKETTDGYVLNVKLYEEDEY